MKERKSVRFIFVIAMYLIIAIGVVAPLSAHDTVGDPTDTSYDSRFKIFTAEHAAITKNGKIDKIQSIFKIDLETGTVWRYRQGVDSKGKSFEEFFEVPNQ